MEIITAVEITPTEAAPVTPLELLEAFTDHTPHWYYLDEDSHHYAAAKGVPACVLAYARLGDGFGPVEYAFVTNGNEHGTTHLAVVASPHPERPLSTDGRRAAVAHLVEALSHFLDGRTHLAAVRARRQELIAA